MATNIMGLFGNYDPDAEARKRQQAFQQQLAGATDPQSFIAAVSTNLGSQLGGMFDNKLTKQDKIARIMQRVGKIADPLGQAQEAYTLFNNEGMTQEAQMMMERIRSLQAESLDTRYKEAQLKKLEDASKEEDTPLSTLGKLLKDREKYTEGSFGYQSFTKMIEKEYQQAADKNPAVGAKAELYAQTKFMKPFSQLDQKQREEVLKATGKEGLSLGDGLAKLASALAAKEISTETAKNTAKEITPTIIQGKENALNALKEAKDLLTSKDGIFAGGYSKAKVAAAKYTPFGSQKTLENTEQFVQKIKTTVVPLLKEFGGNDSNEELRFLEGMQGGDITQEQATIEETVNSAIKKIERGIERTKKTYENISSGKGGVDVTIQENVPTKQITLSNGTVVTVRRKE